MGLAYDAKRDRVWALDGGREQLRAIAADGNVEREITLEHFDLGYPRWSDVAVNEAGEVLAMHSAARFLDRFSADGRKLGRMVLPANSWRVDVGNEDAIVISTARRWNWRLDAGGHPLSLFTLPSPAFGFAHPISDLTTTDDGRILFVDQSNSSLFGYRAVDGGEGDEKPRPEVPPSVDPHCSFQSFIQVEPREVELGETAGVELRIGGDCATHRRGGHRPDVLALDATVSMTLPEGVEWVPGSAQPKAEVAGRVLRWQLADLPHGETRIRFAIRSTIARRWIIPEIGRLETLDGWYNFDAAALPTAVFYTLIPPTETPEAPEDDSPVLYLPRLFIRR
jgi:PAS domain-containing protein